MKVWYITRRMIAIICAICFVLISNSTANARNLSEFVRRQENRLVVGADDQVVWLRGVNFNNNHWEEDASLIVHSKHHSETDFQRVVDMGMNVIRFNLSYVVFEDDNAPYTYKQEGWDWLDQNVAWAKKHGIYLILDMHVPQGGYQGGTDEGLALWNDVENQNRLRALWRAIADRYKDEAIVAGYNLLNEPTPADSVQQWVTLAQQLVDEIRIVDQNHLLIVEKVHTVYNSEDVSDEDLVTQFLVNDNNVMYEFHFYYPGEYIEQNLPFTGTPADGAYPDEGQYYLPWNFEVEDNIADNPSVQEGDWKFYEGVHYKIDNPVILGGYPILSSCRNAGTVFYHDFVIREYDENNSLVWEKPVEISSAFGWAPWSEDESGTFKFTYDPGRSDSVFSIAGVTGCANLANSDYLAFEVRQGYSYQISGWMKGVNISNDAISNFQIEFAGSPSGIPVYRRTRDYLEHQLSKWRAFGDENNVPMNVGEFGAGAFCFVDNQGGLTWVSDMLDLLTQADVHFIYWDYHSPDFGFYTTNEQSLPGAPRQELLDLFTGLLTSVNEATVSDVIPNAYSVSQNYPNPFNPSTVISYSIPNSDFVTLRIYDLQGKEVRLLVDEFRNTGTYQVNFYAGKLASGIYFYRLQLGSGRRFVATRKMLLLR